MFAPALSEAWTLSLWYTTVSAPPVMTQEVLTAKYASPLTVAFASGFQPNPSRGTTG